MNIAYRVRMHHKISQQELARILGCSKQYVNAIERGVFPVSKSMRAMFDKLLQEEPRYPNRIPKTWA